MQNIKGDVVWLFAITCNHLFHLMLFLWPFFVLLRWESSAAAPPQNFLLLRETFVNEFCPIL